MQRPTIRFAGRLALASALLLTLLTPAAVFAADPIGGQSASADASRQPSDPTPSPSASDQEIAVDPTFIAVSATPAGAVLSATGRPQHTLPPTDAVVGPSSAGANAQGLPLLLLALATICLVAARLPEVRRR
jgi:hypothetical protein